MTQTTNYSLNKPQGSDLFAPLTDYNPNWDAIDAAMYENQMASVPRATEAIAATVHNITRNVPDAAMFRFTATGNVGNGDTFTVDGIAVNAIAANGQAITEGAWLTGTEVLACLNGSVCTFYVSASSSDAQTLQGHAAAYFGTAAGVEAAQNTATAAGNVANQASQTAAQALAAAQQAGLNMVKVWENERPASSFNAQTVVLSNVPASTKFYLVRCRQTNSADFNTTCIVLPGVDTTLRAAAKIGSQTKPDSVRGVVISGNTAQFAAGYYLGTSGDSSSALIPVEIYAIG